MSDQEEIPKPPSKKSHRRSKKSAERGSAEPQSPSVRTSAATMLLFAVSGDGDRSIGGDSEGGGDVTASDKRAGKNPRWLAAQEKQRQSDVIRSRIQSLLNDIEDEEDKTEPVMKKAWLLAKRQELRKIVLKQPEDIIENEQFVGKVEQRLAEARKNKGKSSKRNKKRRDDPNAVSSGSESDDENESKAEIDEGNCGSGEEAGSSGRSSENAVKNSKEGEEAPASEAPEDGKDGDKKRAKIKMNKKTRVSYLRDSEEQKEQRNTESGHADENDMPDDKDKNKNSKERNASDSESMTSGRSDTMKDRNKDGAKDGKRSKNRAGSRENKRKEEPDKTGESVKDKGKLKEKQKKESEENEKENDNEKGKGKKDKTKIKDTEVKRGRKKDQSEDERSESESESSKRKWKKPVLRLPSWKKGSDKSSRGTSAADRTEVEGDSAGGGSGSGDGDGRGGSGGSGRGGGGGGGDGVFLWGERLGTPKDAAEKPMRRLSVDSCDRRPSSSDDEASDARAAVYVLEIDASAAFSDNDGVDKVAIKDLPTSGKRGREKRKKKGEAETARKESVIPDIPVLRESVKQKLRETFSIKRKSKRSDDAGEQSDGGDGGDGKGKKKEKGKTNETSKVSAKEKQNGKKDEKEVKKGNATSNGKPSKGMKADEIDCVEPGNLERSWRGASTATRSAMTSRIDDTMHCVSLDDD